MIKNNTDRSIPAVMAESLLPTLSVNTLIASLMSPEARASTALQLDARIAARKSELEKLVMARKALDYIVPITSDISVESDTTLVGNNINHSTAILNALKGEKNGLIISALRAKLMKIGHSIEQKNLSSYVWSMTKNGKILKEGTPGQFRYKLA